MMRKYMCICLVWFISLSVFAFDTKIDGIYYTLNKESKEATVTYKDDSFHSYTAESITIPSKITVDGEIYNVTRIGRAAFINCTELKTITIPNSIIEFGWQAFYGCSNLKGISIPNSMKEISNTAFMECSSLEYINLPESLSKISLEAFIGCKNLKSIYIPNSVTSIGQSAFMNCESLKSVVIPNSVKEIGETLFGGCTNLVSVEMSDAITSIGQYAFDGCQNLKTIYLPNTITVIGAMAFNYCESLTSVVIPNQVTRIEDATFQGCKNLESISIPASVKHIGGFAFHGCTALKTLKCYSEIPPELSGHNSFDNVKKVTLYVPKNAIDSYKITDGWAAFSVIKELEGPEPELQKCSAPVISYSNGKLSYSSETDGAEVVSSITADDMRSNFENEVALTGKYNITAYAVKSGYRNSDISTATLVIASEGSADGSQTITTDGIPLLITQNEGYVTLKGVANLETISIYDDSGKLIDSSSVTSDDVTFNLSNQRGKTVAIRIKEKTAHYIVK